MRDFRRLQNDPPTGVQGAPLDNNIMVRETDLHDLSVPLSVPRPIRLSRKIIFL
jgi:ubiquitin-conjugating enzyme E2 A